MAAQIPQIELGNVVPGATPLSPDERGVNETFIGHFDANSGRHKAYIKVLPARQLVNELVAVTVGRAINLPIPQGYLLRVRPSDLPHSQLLQQWGNGEALVFGSRALEHPTLARRFYGDTQNAAAWLRANFSQWDEATIFDDWIANPDRHLGNLIVAGANQVWLIDHSHCFTGPNWQAQNLQANQPYGNQLANLYIPSLTLPQRVALKDKAGAMTGSFAAVDAEVAMHSSCVDQLLSSTDLESLSNFLSVRTRHILEIMSARVGIPSLGGLQ